MQASEAEQPEGAQQPENPGRPENQGRTNPPGKKPKVWAGTRLVALIAGVAVVSLLAGIAIMQFIVSPAELAARTEPPEAGPVTALVEERVIENSVTTRGEVTYADPVQVTIDTQEAKP